MESDLPSRISKPSVCSYEDVWFEIFKRFPVKALCQFRCVCKSWNSLISSPLFIAHHFSSNATVVTQKSYLLLNGRCNAYKPYALYRPQEPLLHRINFLHFPFEIRHRSPNRKNFKIIDFVQGVVCLDPPVCFGSFLWNPSIRKYVNVPWLPSQSEGDCSFTSTHIGFGFDSSRNDFKLVRISYPHPVLIGVPIFQLFSLNYGQWRELTADNLGCTDVISDNSCFLNGAIHWFATKSRKPKDYIVTYVLLLFDCEFEEFRTLELPTKLANDPYGLAPQDIMVRLYRYDDKLAVMRFYRDYSVCELWVMEEYGVVSTWNMLFKIEQEVMDAYTNFMLRKDGNVFTYADVTSLAPRNPTENTVKRLERRKSHQPVNAFVFEESLFLADQKKPSSDIEEKLVRLISKGVSWSHNKGKDSIISLGH